MMNYVEIRDDVYWVAGNRVSLDSVVYEFLDGQTAESIAQSFPTLSLERVYGAITYYLAHRDEIDAYLIRYNLRLSAICQGQDMAFTRLKWLQIG